jgi:hypothetical protein
VVFSSPQALLKPVPLLRQLRNLLLQLLQARI